MNAGLEVFVELLALLVVARLFGSACERLGQPPAVGELLAGVALAALIVWFGQDVPVLDGLADSATLAHVADLGIFFLVLYAGIELEPHEIARHSGRSFAVALGGMALPLASGFALAWLFLPDTGMKSAQALLVGVALSISAIPATVKVLSDLGLLHSRLGETILSAAIFDDVLGLFLLAVLVSVIETGSAPDPASFALMLLKVAAFFGVTVTLGTHVYHHVRRGLRAMQIAAIEFSALVGVALAYGLLAELLGMHWVLGAFMAGLYFETHRVGPVAYNEMRLIVGALSSGLLGPLFFAYVGLRVDLGAVLEVPLFLALLLAVAVLGKLIGAGLPALWCGLDRREALATGVGLSARGAVELVIISIAAEAGLFAPVDHGDPIVANLFSALVLTAVLTTLLAPLAMRWLLDHGAR